MYLRYYYYCYILFESAAQNCFIETNFLNVSSNPIYSPFSLLSDELNDSCSDFHLLLTEFFLLLIMNTLFLLDIFYVKIKVIHKRMRKKSCE